MLTIKNQCWRQLPTIIFLALGIACLATGCKPAGPRALFAGKKLFEQGKFDSAVEQFKTATAFLPTNALAWNFLGLAQHAAGHANDAAAAYQRALALNPNLLEAHFNLGCLLLEQNNPAAAKSELTTYALSRPKDVNGWLKLGAAQWRLRDAAAAERSYAEALNLNKQLSEAWNTLGLVQLQRNRPADAARDFTAALRCQPDYAPALLNLAIIQQQHLGNRPLALQKYREYAALKSAPNQDAVAALARALEAELNPPPVAVAVAKPPPATPPAIKPLVPTPPIAVVKPVAKPVVTPVAPVAVATPLKTTPPVEPVVAANDEPKKIWPEVTPLPPTETSRTNAGVTVQPKASTLPPVPAPKSIARYAYRSPAKPRPGNRAAAEPALEAGLLHQQRHQLPEALAAFEQAVKADPGYFQAHYNLAWTAYALKDWPTSLEAYELALALDPDSPNARYNFALVLKQAGYPLDAANELARLLVKKPDDAPAHLLTANLYAQQLGGPSLARPHYLRVLELEPQHPQATQIRYWLQENP
jgi:tetratricopeptide (TPR) repeat protein